MWTPPPPELIMARRSPVLYSLDPDSQESLGSPVYCQCRCPDSMDETIQCDRCDAWLHLRCACVRSAPTIVWLARPSHVKREGLGAGTSVYRACTMVPLPKSGKDQSDYSVQCRVQNEDLMILRHCFSRNKQPQNRIQTFETLTEKDKKDTSFVIDASCLISTA